MDVGDKVSVGDMVLVVESDKADMDVESFEEGYIAKILTDAGETAAVGDPIALLAGMLNIGAGAACLWASRRREPS